MRIGQNGFTVIEVIVTVSIVAILAAISTIILIRPQAKSSLETSIVTLVADIKQQQLKAMVGDGEGLADSQAFGVYFETSRYTLFPGASYNPINPVNFIINLESNTTFDNITLPNPLVFDKRSGEITGLIPGVDSLILKSTISQDQKTIIINRYGTININ